MKKITLLITFLMAIVTGGYGQSASTYGFSSSSGTYTNNSAAATLLATVRADSFISTVQPIGFTFVYEGANFTQFKMSSNGFISLGAGTNAQDTNNFSTANATSRPIIAPLWDDLDGVSPASSVACYELTGVAPNRVLTVEWRNWEWNWNSATPVISFQAKLYETTNVIEFVYRQEATAINAGSASIGIGSATGSGAGSYLNLTSIAAPAVSSTASTTTLATKPATGQVYTFTPPMPCTGTPNGGTVSPTSFVLNTGQLPGTIVASGFTSGVTGLTFQWEESTDGFVTPVNAVGGTGATTVSYTPPAYNGTPKEYRLKVTCSGNPGSPGYSSTSSLVSCGPVSVFPWTENFDSLATLGATVFPSCWTKENGDWATTNNANSTTDADARSGTQFLRDSWSATNEYVWTKGFQLTAGTSYDFSFYWAGDTFSGWTGDVFYNTTPNSVGATQLGGSFVAPGTTTTFTYAKSLSTFVPSSSGVYYFAIRVNQPSATPNYLSFDDFRFEPSPACPAPLALTVGNITSNTADFNWTPGASEALWNVQYGPTGFALGTGTILNGEINPTYTAIGLTGNTAYQYYVQADCGAGSTSGWAGPISFTTACNATSIPYAQNFESVTTPALPSCTSVVNAGSGNLWKTTSNPGYGFTTKVLNYTYNSTNPANTWFFTQGINLTGGVSYRISYNYGNDSTTYTEKLQVAYGTSASAAAMTNVIATHATINQQAIQSNLVDFTPATTGVYYFGFQAYSALDQDNLYVDNILIDATPACPSPTALTAGNFTSNTADFVWTPGASEALWNVQYGPTGFVLGTGTIVNGEINPTYTATGLSANTTYQYYVQADCTGASGTSTWAGPFSFTTYCDAVTDFTQNFDAVTAPAMPGCWNKVGTTGTTNTQTASNNTAPNTLYLYSSSAANKVVLRTVPVSNLGDGTHWLRFKMRASGTVGGIVEIGYVTDPADANSFVSLGSVTASTLTYQDYNFTPAAGSYSNYLALRHTGAPANSVLIDDVAWEVIPSCYPPTALLAGNSTANTADFNWTPGGSEGLWNIQYGPTGFVVGTGTIISGEINPTYTAVGLLANTTYQYYVQADCGGSTSTWAGPISFTTACDATNVPYVQNFESVTTPAIPACTSVINEGTGNLWKTVSNPGAGFTTKTLSYTYNFTNAANTWFFTQAINMTGGVSYRISYNYGNDFNAYTEKLKVAYGTSASGAGMTDVIADHPTINQQAIQSNVVDFTPATTGVYYIGFQAYSTANQDNLFVDNISVDLTPACSNPIGLAVNNLTDVGANITWTATSGNYQYVLDNVATDPAGAGTTLAGEAYSAGPLSPTTLYYFHVRTDCGGLFSTWSTISFTTLMPPPVNNDLCNAIALTVGNISAGDAFTNVGSTGQTNEPAPACFNSGINGSVWFSFVSPASGNVQVTTDIAGGTLTDTEIAVYNGTGVTCGDLTTLAAALGCSQDDGVGVDFNSTLNLTGLVSGGTYYVQVDRWGTATDGTFGINVTDSGLSTPSFDTAGFRAYPNPVKDILNLSYTKEMSSVSVFNLLGQEVLTKTVNATQSQVNLSGLSGGTYLVKVTVDGLVKTIKVVKE